MKEKTSWCISSCQDPPSCACHKSLSGIQDKWLQIQIGNEEEKFLRHTMVLHNCGSNYTSHSNKFSDMQYWSKVLGHPGIFYLKKGNTVTCRHGRD